MAVSRDAVRCAYKFILGRPPENEGVVDWQAKQFETIDELGNTFFSSEEYRARNKAVVTKSFVGFQPPSDIDVRTDQAAFAAMVAKTSSYWSTIGATSPHWSVLSDTKYLPEHIGEYKAEFYESGKGDRDFVIALLRRIGRSPDEFQCLAEYGCGVGRVTAPLAGC
jgi:hypothetical protein